MIVFICGAVVMSFEILGSRVLARISQLGICVGQPDKRLSCRALRGLLLAEGSPMSVLLQKLGLMIMVPGALLLSFLFTALQYPTGFS
jgi:hypothetical protein